MVASHETQDTPFYTADAHALLHGSYSPPLGRSDLTGLRFPPFVRHVHQRDAFRAPGYPAFLAIFGGGGGGTSRVLVLVAQTAVVGASVFLAGLWARRLLGPELALAAAGVYAIDPYSKRYAAIVLSEALSGFLLMLVVYALVRAWEERSVRWWAGCGVGAGVLVLVRPVFTLLLPVVLGAALLQRAAGRIRARDAAAFTACAALLIAPWLVRNTLVVGRPVLQGFGVGWGLLAGAHGEGLDHTYSDIVTSPGFLRDFYGVVRFAPPPARYLRDRDAHARYLYRADTYQRSRARAIYGDRLGREPWTVAWEWLYRAYFLWMAHEDWYQPGGLALLLLRLVDWVALALGAGGAVLAWRRGGPARALAIFLVLYTAASAIGHVEARFSVPLRGIYLVFGTLAVVTLLGRRRSAVPAI